MVDKNVGVIADMRDLMKTVTELITDVEIDRAEAARLSMDAMEQLLERLIPGGDAGIRRYAERTLNIRSPYYKIIDYGLMCYPQYKGSFKIPKYLPAGCWQWLQDECRRVPGGVPEVEKHKKSIVDGNVPWGFISYEQWESESESK